MRKFSPKQIKEFQTKILLFHKKSGRNNLPWRVHRSPYIVFLSEYMLQQTQTTRVIQKLDEFLKKAPTIEKLASLSQINILKLWQGLGYNTRALRLHRAVKEIVSKYNGKIPKDKDDLLKLPGVGPYTAGAMRVFAYNLPDIFIETNIRRVFIHEFFKNKKEIHDLEILKLVEQTLYRKDPRTWYEGLMDYGAILPKQLVHNPNIKSKHYTKQSKFKGSDREIRGRILRNTLAKKKTLSEISNEDPKRIQRILSDLKKDGFKIKIL